MTWYRNMPLLWPVALWVTGLMLSRSALLPVSYAVMIAVILLFRLMLMRRYRLCLLLFFALLWGGGNLFLDGYRVATPSSWLQKTMAVTATVERIEQHGYGVRLLLSHLRNEDGDDQLGRGAYARLYSYRLHATSLSPGQRIAATVRWHLPHNRLNPVSFDYRGWCFDHAIAVIGSSKTLHVINTQQSTLEGMQERVRAGIQAVDGDKGRAILTALLLGDRSLIAPDLQQRFSATGTAHLLAISGMHVGMVAALLFALCWWILTRREAWVVALPVRNVSLLIGLSGALLYAMIAGMPLPAQRSFIMLTAAVAAWLLKSRAQPLNTLLAALAAILLFDPSAIGSLSLWLSFTATAALLLWSLSRSDGEDSERWQTRLLTYIRALFWVSLVAGLATLPLTLATFGQVPTYTLLANMLLVPLYGLLVLPLALCAELIAIVGWHDGAVVVMQWGADALVWGEYLLSMLMSLPAASLWAVEPAWWLQVIYVVGIAIALILIWKQRLRWSLVTVTAVVAFYMLMVLPEHDVNEGDWLVWDVGQGAASGVILPHHTVFLVDAPGRKNSRYNGGTTVAANLRKLGLTHADVLLFTHAQSDHMGGGLSLMQHLNRVGELWLADVPDTRNNRMTAKLLSKAEEDHVRVRWLAKGDVIQRESYRADILWPPRGYQPSNANNGSLVVMLTLPTGLRMLLGGDIERPAEHKMVNSGLLQHVDMMLMPHHGSRSSSSAAFLAALSPHLVVAQTGFANHYGFPARDVVARYRAMQARVLNSAEGAVIVPLPALQSLQSLHVHQWRAQQLSRRAWVTAWWQRTLF